ncbi:integrase family protein (plasmid) [Phyllobacterium sp. A18/5-2]|uniref:tyrosine-type recombinase/integrase n=1 Tax=Phyllobacterium sp. A18/5-2 TaxID=2978392 RepID=UPI0021CAD1B6|nr:integrase family protein [Phyllobacterium sp. A18/5-2]UXN66034.1 integrase family protein [Phyllobacterium sp. A18/5-2]
MRRPQNGLTDALIKSLKLAPRGTVYDVGDAGETKRLRLRVSSTSKRFYMSGRWGKRKSSATLRAIGPYKLESIDELEPTDELKSKDGYFTLRQAREKAREWDRKRKVGIDPKQADAVEQRRTFAALVQEYLKRPEFLIQRQANKYKREIERELTDEKRNPWVKKGVSEIDDGDIASLVEAIRDRPAPSQAWHIMGHIRLIFKFAMRPVNRRRLGLEVNPAEHLDRDSFGLKKVRRQVLLDDELLSAFWAATMALGYPFGPMYQLLCLGGQRISNWQKAHWTWINLAKRELTIPGEFFQIEGAPHRQAFRQNARDTQPVASLCRSGKRRLFVFIYERHHTNELRLRGQEVA